MKILPNNITERVWYYNQFPVDELVLELYKKEVLVKEYQMTKRSSGLWFADVEFGENDYFVTRIFNVFSDYKIFKCGETTEDFLYTQGPKGFTINSSIFSITGEFEETLSMTEVFPCLYKQSFGTRIGSCMVYSKGDFKLLKLPFKIEEAAVYPNEGKIILQPGFNMIAWQGSGKGSYSEKGNTTISSNVKNSISDQLKSVYGDSTWRGCRTYKEVEGKFLDYIEGFTPEDAEGNFDLVAYDNGNREVKGVQIFTLVPYEMELYYW